jgi:hypothetical protein
MAGECEGQYASSNIHRTASSQSFSVKAIRRSLNIRFAATQKAPHLRECGAFHLTCDNMRRNNPRQ